MASSHASLDHFALGGCDQSKNGNGEQQCGCGYDDGHPHRPERARRVERETRRGGPGGGAGWGNGSGNGSGSGGGSGSQLDPKEQIWGKWEHKRKPNHQIKEEGHRYRDGRYGKWSETHKDSEAWKQARKAGSALETAPIWSQLGEQKDDARVFDRATKKPPSGSGPSYPGGTSRYLPPSPRSGPGKPPSMMADFWIGPVTMA